VPVPTTPVPPPAIENVPAALSGTLSAGGFEAAVFGTSAPALTVFFKVLLGVGEGLLLGLGLADGDADPDGSDDAAAADAGSVVAGAADP
jgi:hypothetical protein